MQSETQITLFFFKIAIARFGGVRFSQDREQFYGKKL